jgi:hypothetical protein
MPHYIASPYRNTPDGQLSGLLPSLVVALRYPLLIGFFLPIFILAVEIPAQEPAASADGRAKASIPSDSSDNSPAGSTSSPAGKRTLLRLSHPCTSTNGDQYDHDKAYSQISHRLSLTKYRVLQFHPHPNPPPYVSYVPAL